MNCNFNSHKEAQFSVYLRENIGLAQRRAGVLVENRRGGRSMCVRGKAMGLRRQLTAEQRDIRDHSGLRIEKQVPIFPLSTLGSTYGSGAAGVDCGNVRGPSLLSRRTSRCALHFKRKGSYERTIYKEEISVVCVVS